MPRTEMCPCGTGEPIAACCGRLHAGRQAAATAEQLMRSRYSAFALGEEGYLLDSWHPSTRPGRVRLDPGQEWTRLEIVGRTGGGPFDTEGTVEFRAHYRGGTLHENSGFVREDGAWFYVAAV
ncbi:MAG: YchJ family protein [Actinophytocola sp.]|uniref:YchJ family protein n=1 Tax=Actinophytocola sp. TaxID=1872138 RepID=UPI003D6AC49C